MNRRTFVQRAISAALGSCVPIEAFAWDAPWYLVWQTSPAGQPRFIYDGPNETEARAVFRVMNGGYEHEPVHCSWLEGLYIDRGPLIKCIHGMYARLDRSDWKYIGYSFW